MLLEECSTGAYSKLHVIDARPSVYMLDLLRVRILLDYWIFEGNVVN